MAKVTDLGLAKPDDPLFTGSYEMFSPHAFRPSSTTSAPGTDGATPATSPTSSTEPSSATDPMQLSEDPILGVQRARDRKLAESSAPSTTDDTKD